MPDDRCERFEAELTAYHQDELLDARREEVRAHLADCEACASALRQIRGVFTVAGEVEDLVPSLRLKRSVAKLLSGVREERLPLGERVRASLAYLAHRFRTSWGFRVATVSVGAHVALLLLLSFVWIPRAVEEKPGVIRPGIGRPIAMEDRRLPDPARNAAPAPLPDWGDVSPEVVENHPFGGTEREPDLPDVGPFLPPVHRPVVQPLAGLFSTTIDPDVKRRRLAACLKDPEAAMESVGRALAWLAGRQREDGAFPSSARGAEYETGVTAAAVLAFASDGHSETRGRREFRVVVRKAVNHLLSSQHSSGVEQGLIGPARGHFAYNHALATIALVEAYVMDYRRVPAERTLELKRALRLAVDYIVRSQLESGAWPYGSAPDARQADTSVAIYMGMALRAARSARIPVPESATTGLARWLRSVTDEDGLVGYLRPGDRKGEAPTLTAGALHVEEILGLAAPVRDRQAELVLDALGDPNRVKRNGLLRFYAALAFRARGNPVLDRFVPEMIATQAADGSWDSEGDEWAVYGGDVFLTALNVMTLTSAFRLVG